MIQLVWIVFKKVDDLDVAKLKTISVDLKKLFDVVDNEVFKKKKFRIKANTKFCLSLHVNADNNYLFVNGKEIFKFKVDDKNVNFPTQFCFRSISNRFSATETREVFLNGNVYHFSIDYNSIHKSDILNIRKYLMTKNSIK